MIRLFPHEAPPGSPHRLVLDTNVVLDLVVFRDAGARGIARALDCGEAIAVTSRACLEELSRVLAYPQLKLDPAAQSRALEDFRARAVLFAGPDSGACADLPRCADPDDQKFLELAWRASAGFLVTKDKALLRMSRAFAALGRFTVIGPGALGAQLQAG